MEEKALGALTLMCTVYHIKTLLHQHSGSAQSQQAWICSISSRQKCYVQKHALLLSLLFLFTISTLPWKALPSLPKSLLVSSCSFYRYIPYLCTAHTHIVDYCFMDQSRRPQVAYEFHESQRGLSHAPSIMLMSTVTALNTVEWFA